MILKIWAYTLKGYIKDSMNVLDGVIVIISLSELFFDPNIRRSNKNNSAHSTVKVLRGFRILRIIRILRAISFMKVIVGVVSRSI